MLHLNSGFEKRKPTRDTKAHGCLAFSHVALQLPPQTMQNPASCLPEMVWKGWIARDYLWKRPLNSKHPPKTQHTEICLSPKRGAPGTVLMNAARRVASHPAKLAVNTDILLSGRREAQEEGMTPLVLRRTLCPPLLGERMQGAELAVLGSCCISPCCGDWTGSHNSNTVPASRFVEQ